MNMGRGHATDGDVAQNKSGHHPQSTPITDGQTITATDNHTAPLTDVQVVAATNGHIVPSSYDTNKSIGERASAVGGRDDVTNGDWSREQNDDAVEGSVQLNYNSENYLDLRVLPAHSTTSTKFDFFLMIDGQAYSFPTAQNARLLGEIPNQSLSYRGRLEWTWGIEPCFHMDVYHQVILENGRSLRNYYGHIALWFRHMLNLQIFELPHNSTVKLLSELAGEAPDVDQLTTCTHIQVEMERSHVHLERTELKRASSSIQKQFENLFTALNRKKDSKTKVSIYFRGHYSDSSPLGMNLRLAINLHDKFSQGSIDPMADWFLKSPHQKLLTWSTIIRRSDRDVKSESGKKSIKRIELPPVPAKLAFPSLPYYNTAQAYGTIDELEFSIARKNVLKKSLYECYYMQHPVHIDLAGNPTKMLVMLRPGKRGVFLPQKGSTCRIVIKGLARARNDNYKIDVVRDLPRIISSQFVTRAALEHTADDAVEAISVITDDAPLEKVKKIKEALKHIYVMYQDSQEQDAEMDELTQMVTEHQDCLRAPFIQNDFLEEENLMRMKATRIDCPLVDTNPSIQVYIVTIPWEPLAECIGGQRRRIKLPSIPKPEDGQAWADFVQGTVKKTKTTCSLEEEPCEKPLRQELMAFSDLQRPMKDIQEDIQSMLPTGQAIARYRWLAELHDPAGQPMLHLFDQFPLLSAPIDGTAHPALQKGYDSFDESQKATYQSLESLIHGLAPIAGTAACGKTRFLCFVVQALLHYYPKEKALVIFPNNAAVDDFAVKFVDVCKQMGFADNEICNPLRAYAFASESKAGIKLAGNKVNSDQHTTSNEENDQPDQHDISNGDNDGAERPSLEDEFLANYVIQSSIDRLPRKKSTRKNFGKASLHVEVFEQYRANPHKWPRIQLLVEQFTSQKHVSEFRLNEAKLEMDEILMDILANAGIVVTTASAARESKFRKAFKPTAVFQDENCRSRELTTLMMLSSFPSAILHMLLGDPRQLQPFLESASSMYDEDAIQATFAAQIQLSLLERLFRTGLALGDGLTHNHRQKGNLADLPSKMFYGTRMLKIGKQQTAEADQVRRMIARILGCKLKQNRVMVNIRGSEEKRVGTSWTNPIQIQFVVFAVNQIRKDPEFKRPDGKPGRIAVLAMYDAAVSELELSLRLAGLLDEYVALADQVQEPLTTVRTVDGAQGIEAEVVIIVTCRTTLAPFISEVHRMNVAMTRSIYGEIIVFDHKSLSLVKNSTSNRITRTLAEAHRLLQKADQVVDLDLCKWCGRFDHGSDNCPAHKPCSRCKEQGHTEADCTKIQCVNCGQHGHTSYSCQNKRLICRNCSESGHKAAECPHSKRIECKLCGEDGHIRKDCPDKAKYPTICFRCGESGHIRRDCPNRISHVCTECGCDGHAGGKDICTKNPPLVSGYRRSADN